MTWLRAAIVCPASDDRQASVSSRRLVFNPTVTTAGVRPDGLLPAIGALLSHQPAGRKVLHHLDVVELVTLSRAVAPGPRRHRPQPFLEAVHRPIAEHTPNL